MHYPSLDLLVRIKNAYQAGKKQVTAPASNFIIALADLIKANNFIKDYTVTEDDGKRQISLNLIYNNNIPVMSGLKIYSKPGRRIYCHSQNIPWGNRPEALIIISTSSGLKNQRQAQKAGQGGELIAQIW